MCVTKLKRRRQLKALSAFSIEEQFYDYKQRKCLHQRPIGSGAFQGSVLKKELCILKVNYQKEAIPNIGQYKYKRGLLKVKYVKNLGLPKVKKQTQDN